MKRVVLNFALAVALSGAQAALLHRLGGGRLSLALPLALAVWLGLEAPLLEGVFAALAVGWAVDVFGAGPQGLLTFLAVVLYLTSRMARTALAFHGRAGFAAMTALGTFFFGATAFVLQRATAAPEVAPAAALLWRVALEALGTGLVAAVLHPALAWLERSLVGEDEPDVLGGRL
jgi:hypothetical protein